MFKVEEKPLFDYWIILFLREFYFLPSSGEPALLDSQALSMEGPSASSEQEI